MKLTEKDRAALVHYLNFVCNNETSKPIEEMNMELINACTNVLLTLQDKHTELNSGLINEKVRKIFHPEDEGFAAPETVNEHIKAVNKKKVWFIAACAALLSVLLCMVGFGSMDNPFKAIREFFGIHSDIAQNELLDVGKDTYYWDRKNGTYANVSEAALCEKADLLIPTGDIKEITVTETPDSRALALKYTESSLSVDIVIGTELSDEIEAVCTEKYIFDGREYLLCIMDDVNRAQAYYSYNGNLYTVNCTNAEELKNILNNMEEIKNEN